MYCKTIHEYVHLYMPDGKLTSKTHFIIAENINCIFYWNHFSEEMNARLFVQSAELLLSEEDPTAIHIKGKSHMYHKFFLEF